MQKTTDRNNDFRETNFSDIVKCEMVIINDGEFISTDLINLISANLIKEAYPVCYGCDDRWANHLYPVFLTESFCKSKYYSSEVILTKSEFVDKIKQYHSNFEIDFSNENQIEILEYTEGQRIKTIKLGNLELTGTEIRNIFGLKSAKFEISVDGENVKFKVIGYGHGVGMSQTGADSMAKNGSRAEEIIKHFYTGVEITEVNKL